MKPVKFLSGLFFTALMAMAISGLFSVPFAPTYGGLVATSFLMPQNVAFMALQKEIWRADIINNLFKDNQFAQRCVNADSFVLQGKVVHIPVAGTPATTKKNLTSFPQTAVNRTDTELTYALDTLYSLPRQIQDIEKYELSYDKRQSVVGEDQKQLIQDAMDSLLYRWAPTASGGYVIETTGDDSAADLIDGTATGTRKKFTSAEFKKVIKKLRQANMAGKITALLTVSHYHQLIESFSEGEKTAFMAVADLKNGIVGKYYGADVIFRSSVLRYRKVSSVWTVVDEQSDSFSAGTGDSAASLFYSDMAVERAVGDVVVFDDSGNPLYYGDVFSQYLRIGGRKRRTEGVYAVVDAIGA